MVSHFSVDFGQYGQEGILKNAMSFSVGEFVRFASKIWSGRRGSNPQPTAWEAATLPLSYSRFVRNYTPRNQDESTYAFASNSTKARNLASISVAEVVG